MKKFELLLSEELDLVKGGVDKVVEDKKPKPKPKPRPGVPIYE